MELHELKPAPGARRPRKVRGRGSASGLGKTAGRGQKGAKARTGAHRRRGFEGGQMPLLRRLPKIGFFTPPHQKTYAVLNVGDLEKVGEEAEITPELLLKKRLVRALRSGGLKILGGGKLSRKLSVAAHAFSASARKAIEAAGGTCRVIGRAPAARSSAPPPSA